MASNIRVTLELDNKTYIANIDQAKNKTEDFSTSAQRAGDRATTSLSKMGNVAENVAGQLKKLAAAYIGLETIRSALTLADDIADLSKATDISITSILALQKALAAAGGQSDDAGKLISNLQNTLAGAQEGGAQAQEQLLKLGFTFRDMANLTPEEALQKTIQRLAGMTDATQRNALAFQVLGKAARNIDWDEVNKKYAENSNKNDELSAAVKKAGEFMDRLAENAKNLKTTIILLIAPFIDLYDYVAKLAGGGNGGVFGALSFVLKAVAIGFATVAMAVSGVITDFKTLLDLAPAVFARDWDKAGKIIDERNKKIESSYQGLADFIDKMDLFGRKPAETAAPEPTKKPSMGQGAVTPYYAKEVEALKAISRAYNDNATAMYSNIKAETLKLSMGEDSIAMMEATRKITEEYNKAITDINAKIDQEKMSSTAASAAKVAQLKIERETIGATYDEQLKKIPELIRARQSEISAAKAFAASFDDMVNKANAYVDFENEMRKIGQSPLEKQIIDLDTAARKAIQSLANAEALRRFGRDFIINPQQFIDPKTGEFIDAEMKKFVEKVRNSRAELANQQAENLIQITEAQRTFLAGWSEAYASWLDETTNTAKQAKGIFETVTKGFEDAIVRFVQTGKLSFRDLFNSLIAQAARVAANRLLMSIFGSFMGSGFMNGGFGTGFRFGNQDIGGFLAAGGPAQAGKPYIVGENGPELFVPNSSGTVIPNGAAIGGGQNITQVTYNIQAVDASSFRSLVARDPEFIYNVTEQGRRSLPTRSRR